MLATEERAAVAAAVLALGADAPETLLRVSPGAAEAAGALLALDRDARAAAVAAEVARLLAPAPAGLALVHRDWIEAALAGETALVREAVAGGGALSEEGRRWLQRRALGALVDMPDEGAGGAAALARADVPALLDALAALGRDAVAAGLADEPAAAVAQVAARLGEPHGSALVADVARWRADGDRDRRVAAAAFARGVPGGASERMLRVAGARRLGGALARAGGDARRQVAQRLPRDTGREVLAGEGEGLGGDVDAFARLVGQGHGHGQGHGAE